MVDPQERGEDGPDEHERGGQLVSITGRSRVGVAVDRRGRGGDAREVQRRGGSTKNAHAAHGRQRVAVASTPAPDASAQVVVAAATVVNIATTTFRH